VRRVPRGQVAQLPAVTAAGDGDRHPGASADVVANTVTTPLEEQINGVKGMVYMSSVSANDGSVCADHSRCHGYLVVDAAVAKAARR
jgi:AcrB/AcrD/AcrF family